MGSSSGTGSGPQQQVDIQVAITDFENVLTDLVSSVSKFEPSQDAASRLIEANDSLLSSFETLKSHQEYGQTILNLKKESDELDKQLNSLLIGLSDCRRELMSLPSRDDETTDQQQVDAEQLLSYARKITKFTHAPPGYDPVVHQQTGLPWPSEDELRRGVLAMTSVGDEDLKQPSSLAAAAEQAPNANATNAASSQATQRRGSMVSYDQEQPPPVQQQPKVLDLDLFDPDDDDDDDDDD